MIILFDSGQMTCDSFKSKSNGFEEGGEEDIVVVVAEAELLIAIGEEFSLLIVEFLGNVEELLDSTVMANDDDPLVVAVDEGKVNVEFFICDFKLDEDEEDFNIDDGFAGTKN